jgi:hypothetical protein
MGQAKTWFETRCDIHGSLSRETNDRRVKVSQPESKRQRHSGCPICKKIINTKSKTV